MTPGGVGGAAGAVLRASLGRTLPYALLAAGAFVAGMLLGGAVGAANGTTTVVPIREGGEPAVSRSAGFFLRHNVAVAFQLAAGALTGGVWTLYVLLFNGFLAGALLVEAAAILGVPTAVALIAPHGVFELPALWLAGGVGVRWVHFAWRVATGDRSGSGLYGLLRDTAVVMAVVVGLLTVAAVVEAHVTLPLAELVAGDR